MEVLNYIKNSSFLEVTINSSKLTQMLETISNLIQSQNTKIISNYHHFTNIINEMQKNINVNMNLLQNRIQMMQVKTNEQIIHRKMYLKSIDEELDGKVIKMENKMDVINRKMQQVRELNQIQCKHIQQVLTHQIKENKEIDNQKDSFIDSWVKNLEKKIQRVATYTQEEMHKVLSLFENNIQSFKKIQIPQQTQLMYQETFAKKIKKKRNKCDSVQFINFASVSAKLQNLENRLNQNENKSLNHVIYSTNNQIIKESPFKKQSNKNQKDSQLLNETLNFKQIRSFNGQMSIKIDQIEDHALSKVKSISQEMNIFSNKIIVIQQKINHLYRKIQKQHVIVNDCSAKIKIMEQKRVDERLYENILKQIRFFKEQVLQNVQNKVNQERFEKEKLKNQEKVNFIQENLNQKADKTEIKKAFLFLQDKIKEIIILIADAKDNQKDGVITKTPLKCLSCDRDLLSNVSSPTITPILSPNHCIPYTAISNRIKKRIKANNQSVSLNKQ